VGIRIPKESGHTGIQGAWFSITIKPFGKRHVHVE
jgi:hypothetical protein